MTPDTFFRVVTTVPLLDKYMHVIHTGPYFSQLEANTVMMEGLTLILNLNKVIPALMDLDLEIHSEVQECIIIDRDIEVLNVPASETRPTRDFISY